MEEYEHAAGGSRNVYWRDGLIYKKHTPGEEAFYREASGNGELGRLGRFMPKYYGTKECVAEGASGKFILLEDLNHGVRHPSAIDLKLGRRHWTREMGPQKIERKILRSARSTSSTHSIRFCGMRTPALSVNKKEGRGTDEHRLRRLLDAFFIAVPAPEICGLIAELGDLREAVSRLDGVRFCGVSLLVFHSQRGLLAKLIDFENALLPAHLLGRAAGESGCDKDTVDGIDYLIAYLRGLARV